MSQEEAQSKSTAASNATGYQFWLCDSVLGRTVQSHRTVSFIPSLSGLCSAGDIAEVGTNDCSL